MAQTIINNGDTGLVARTAINDNFTELYGVDLKTEWFEEIASGTSGTLTKPTGSTILLNSWADGVDALASVSGGVGDLPTFETPVTGSGTAITATLDAAGNWTLSGTPSAYPVCIIYAYSIPVALFNEAESLTVAQTYGTATGDVTKVGTPVNNQIGVWTGDGTIEGDSGLQYDSVQNQLQLSASSSLVINGEIVIGDSTGTKTIRNIDALDATTEDTIFDALGTSTTVENVAGAKTDWDLADAGKTFIATGTTATWTFPANSSVAYPIGTVINIINNGSGLLTIALTTDTLDSASNNVDVSVDSMATMVKTASTAWTLAGGLE